NSRGRCYRKPGSPTLRAIPPATIFGLANALKIHRARWRENLLGQVSCPEALSFDPCAQELLGVGNSTVHAAQLETEQSRNFVIELSFQMQLITEPEMSG